MAGSNDSSAAAGEFVVKVKGEQPGDEEESGEVKNNGNAKAKAKAKAKGKGKGKGKGNAEAGNHVRDGPPVRDDPWDGLRIAWAEEISQSTNGGQGTQQNQPPIQQQQHNHSNNHHPNGQQSGSASAPRRGRSGGGGHVPAAQKRKVTEGVTDDGHCEPAPKRPKNDARPHPEFWHLDGSVIIQVEKTKFKLHQTMLQKQSAYFAAAFLAKGNHKRGGRAYLEVEIDERSPNGRHLPVYRITETTADDFATLLTVIEEPMKYADEMPMPVLAGVLRASRDLSFKAQLVWAGRILERMWPAELDSLTNDPIPHAAVALALARTCGLRGVQKRASYEVLRMPTFGQAIVAAPAAHVEVQEDSRADTKADVEMGLDELPRADLLRLLHAREQLVLAWAEIAGRAPTDFVCPRGTQTQIMPEGSVGGIITSSNDTRRLSCASASANDAHARWAELVHTSGLYVQRMVDPLMGLQDLMEIPWREEGYCKKCIFARTNAWSESRKRLWNDLDGWLGLTTAEDA